MGERREARGCHKTRPVAEGADKITNIAGVTKTTHKHEAPRILLSGSVLLCVFVDLLLHTRTSLLESQRRRDMGNIESGPGDPLGPVGSLKHRLQSLEETIQSIEVRGPGRENHTRIGAAFTQISDAFVCGCLYEDI